ncbi:MAG: methylated-DNA--[protein]-cysteine S-methyltransferase [Dehalococcoidia bacterium]
MREYGIIETELGWVGVLRSPHGVCATTLPHAAPIQCVENLPLRDGDRELDEPTLALLTAQVRARAHGDPVELQLELDLSRGTAFQQAVWRAVISIPYGETRSYGWVACEIGNPLASHAVGQAIGRNPLPLLIPCHRVIAADGSLGGFGRGSDALPTKRSLLRREGIRFAGQTLEQTRAVEE